MPWAFYGDFSGVHLFTNPSGLDIRPTRFDATALAWQQIGASAPEMVRKLRLAMLVHGVDLNARASGVLSSAHSDDDVAQTIEALRGAIGMLKADGDL